jgi:hypothetical protein
MQNSRKYRNVRASLGDAAHSFPRCVTNSPSSKFMRETIENADRLFVCFHGWHVALCRIAMATVDTKYDDAFLGSRQNVFRKARR